MLITKTLQEIADLVGGTIKGTCSGDFTGVASLKEAMSTDVAFLGNDKYAPQVLPSKAGAVLVSPEYSEEPPEGRAWIVCADPSREFSKVVAVFTPPPVEYKQGIHPSAVIDETADVDSTASIGPCAVIGKNAKIGAGTVICAGTCICEDSIVGENCLLYPNVTVRERCILGNKVILHPGVVIGADGFGYDSGPTGHTKVPQVGIVQIDDEVEIGANSCIDRARFGRTWIQRGTKIDNLVQIGHNVQTGQACLIVSQVGISGSTVLGNGVILAGQAGVAGHLSIGDGTILMAQAGLSKDAEPKSVLFGSPAMDRREYARQMLNISKIADMNAAIKKLTAELDALKEQLENSK